MDAFENIIRTIRQEASKTKDHNFFFFGDVNDDNQIITPSFTLDDDDYLLADNLLLSSGDKVFIVRPSIDVFFVVCKVSS